MKMVSPLKFILAYIRNHPNQTHPTHFSFLVYRTFVEKHTPLGKVIGCVQQVIGGREIWLDL